MTVSERPPAEPELLGLFIAEIETGAPQLQDLVLALEGDATSVERRDEAMRLTHSLKGAARIVGLPGVVSMLHAAEDLLSAQRREIGPDVVQTLLRVVDMLQEMSTTPAAKLGPWLAERKPELADIEGALRRTLRASVQPPLAKHESLLPPPPPVTALDQPEATWIAGASPPHDSRAVRVPAESMTRLLGYAGEAVVEARRLGSLQRSSFALERLQHRLTDRVLEIQRRVRASGDAGLMTLVDAAVADAAQARSLVGEMRGPTADGLQRLMDVGERLYIESLRARQRPFAQLVPALRRQVREAARALGKSTRLDVIGAATLVDGDVLNGMEPILHHLITNAVDHGIEGDAERTARGKPLPASVKVELRHAQGALLLTVADDGSGIDTERLRSTVVERGHVDAITAQALSAAELHEFLFLPGFSTRSAVSVHSGRGVGLDAVRTEVNRMGGRIAVHSVVGVYTRFELTLPVTRVVVRALLVEVAGETYALPLMRTGRVLRVPVTDVRSSEGRDYVEIDSANVGLVRADDLLDLASTRATETHLTLVLLGDEGARYGLVVDAALGEDDLVVRPLDPRLGRVPDVAATALTADGSPTLLLDADDLLQSIEKLTRRQRPNEALVRAHRAAPTGKRILVVDDSFTVREVERQLLASQGYAVDVAVDGLDGWTMLRNHAYDLAVVDIDMPRMNGLELIRHIREDAALARLPVIIVSYKDRDEDRLRGLEVGADHYLAKSSFQDDQLVGAVRDLIGGAR